MDQAVLNDRFILFIVLWGVLAASAVLFLARSKDTARKQKALPWFGTAFGLLFVGMTQFLGLPPEALVIVVPMVAFIVFVNVRAIRFCPQCGAYNVSTTALRVKFCRSCGQSLEKTAL